jgi:hypothetical protein
MVNRIPILVCVALLATLYTTRPETAAAQFRASVGCPAEKIDNMSPNATLQDLECKCFNKCPSSAPPTPGSSQRINERRFTTYEGRDIDGHDYDRKIGVNFETCISHCKNDLQCVAYSFDKWNRYCFLKDAIPTVLRVEPNSIVGVVSSASPSVSASRVVIERYSNRIFNDPPFKQLQTASYKGCEDVCYSEDRCEVFTFVRADKLCKLIARPGEHFRENSTDSGVKRQKP